jgi:ion channel-forming bestrophin family protein
MLIEARISARYLISEARRDLFVVLLISGAVELLVTWQRSSLPDIPLALPAFLGTAISLLLSFKLNQSYDRWWEARKIWGSIVNESRTLVRQALSFTHGQDQAVSQLALRQIAWCYCLGQSLRRLDWKLGSVDLLTPAELVEAEDHDNKPLALLQFHARDIARWADAGQLSDYQRIALDATLTRLTDAMGMAERIRNTVFPTTYRLFLHIFIYVFITILSVALAEVRHGWQLALTTATAIPFLLLEKTAKHMQDPFSNRPTDTSVSAIARAIDINLRQLIGERRVPPPWPDQGFYIM